MRILGGIDLPADMVCGSLILASDLYAALRDCGQEVTFACLAGGTGSTIVAGAVALPVAKGATEDPAYLAGLRQHVRQLESRPDLLHIHHLAYGMSQTLLSLHPSVPAIGFAHGTDIYDAKRDSGIRDLVGDIAARCSLVLFPTVSLVREALDAGIVLPVSRIRVLPWGVPHTPAPGTPEQGAIATTSVHQVLAAGRLTSNKDFITLVRTMALLSGSYRLTIFGEGREETALREEIDTLGLADRVRLRPMIDRRELWAMMRRASCAVFPTKETEAFGMFGVECQATGVPLIVSSIPVFGEVFGASAMTFQAADPSSLAATVREVCENARLRRTLSLAGLVNAHRYDIVARATQIATLGASLVGGKRI